MSDNKTKKKVLTEKLKYLYKMQLSERKFQVNEIDIDYEEMQNTEEEWILERVNISVRVSMMVDLMVMTLNHLLMIWKPCLINSETL